MKNATTWAELLDLNVTADPDPIVVVASRTVRYSCGTLSTYEVHKERGSWYLVSTSGVRERFTSKRAAMAALTAA